MRGGDAISGLHEAHLLSQVYRLGAGLLPDDLAGFRIKTYRSQVEPEPAV